MSEDLLEYVATISVIKAFSNEENRTERVLGGMRDYIRWVKRSMFSVTVPMTLITMFLEGGIVVMTLIGLWMMSSGELTVARFILALILGGLFSSSFAKLATFQHFRIVYGQSLAKSAVHHRGTDKGHGGQENGYDTNGCLFRARYIFLSKQGRQCAKRCMSSISER